MLFLLLLFVAAASWPSTSLLNACPPARLFCLHLQPHIDSYDYFLGEGMQHVIDNMDGVEIEHSVRCAGSRTDRVQRQDAG